MISLPIYDFEWTPPGLENTQNFSNTQLIQHSPLEYQLPDISFPQVDDYMDYYNYSYPEYYQYPQVTTTRTIEQNVEEFDEQPEQQEKQEPKQPKKQQTSNNQLAEKIINTARQYLGGKYVWGGKSPSSGGFDCSGLLYYAYKKNGVKLGSSSYYIFKEGQEVKNLSQVQPGDIICTTGNGPTGRHVKMVSKIVNGKIYTIEAKGRKYGIVEEPLKNTKNIKTIRRIIPSAKRGIKLLRRPDSIWNLQNILL